MDSELYNNEEELKTAILAEALLIVPFEGWHNHLLAEICHKLSISKSLGELAFPGGTKDLLAYFYQYLDEEMQKILLSLYASPDKLPDDMKIREKIYTLIITRLEISEKYKDAIRKSMSFCFLHQSFGMKRLWQSADLMWHIAGDKSIDYNYYTKRGLLSALYVSTILYWLNDDSDNFSATRNFVQRRIETIIQLGRSNPLNAIAKSCRRLFTPLKP